MAICPKCSAAVPIWTLVKQTNWSSFSCRGCGTRLHIPRRYTMAIAGLGGSVLLFPWLFKTGTIYGIGGMAAMVVLVVLLTLKAPIEQLPDGK
jgi:hypothetical protein